MNMRTFALLLLVFSGSILSYGQNNEFDEIINYVDSTQIKLKKGRAFIASAIDKNDIANVKKGMSFVHKEGKSNYLKGFSFNEFFAICLIAQDYRTILEVIKEFDVLNGPYSYPEDRLPYLCYRTLRDKKDIFEQQIANASLDEQAKFVLQSSLTYFAQDQYSDDYREANKAFTQKNVNSPYTNFVADVLPMPRFLGGSFFTAGATYFRPFGQLGNDFDISGWGGHLCWEFLINRYYFNLFIHGGNLRVNNPFTLSNSEKSYTFTDKDKFNYFAGGLELGYDLIKSRKVMLAPNIGLMGGTLESMLYEDVDKKEFQFFNSFIYSVNLSTAFTFLEMAKGSVNESYLGLKLKVGLATPAKFKIENYSGSIGTAELGLVWGFGSL